MYVLIIVKLRHGITKTKTKTKTKNKNISLQHYLIKFVSDLRQVGGFLRFPSTIKLK
jgi:hypothetical protein